MAKTYSVTLPVSGTAVVEVEADSEEDAIDKALDSVTNKDLETWEALRRIVMGNVFCGQQNEAEAILIDEED